MSQKPLTYADAGVSIDAGNALVKAIGPLARSTARAGADAELGGFGGFFDLKAAGYDDPLLVAANDAPVVVDSAGCGAANEGLGRLLGTAEARAVLGAGARLLGVARHPTPARATRHRTRRWWSRTRATSGTCRRPTARCRTVLAPAYRLRETSDDGLCCGAGGAYAALEPELSTAIRQRKVDAIRLAGERPDPLVVSANPGCAMHLGAAGLDVRHPAELLADALEERPRG